MPLLGNSMWTMTNMPNYITVTKIQRKTNLTGAQGSPSSPHTSCWMVICDDDIDNDVDDDVDEGERWYLIIISEILTNSI